MLAQLMLLLKTLLLTLPTPLIHRHVGFSLTEPVLRLAKAPAPTAVGAFRLWGIATMQSETVSTDQKRLLSRARRAALTLANLTVSLEMSVVHPKRTTRLATTS